MDSLDFHETEGCPFGFTRIQEIHPSGVDISISDEWISLISMKWKGTHKPPTTWDHVVGGINVGPRCRGINVGSRCRGINVGSRCRGIHPGS